MMKPPLDDRHSEDLDHQYVLGLIERDAYLNKRPLTMGPSSRPPGRERKLAVQLALLGISLIVVFLLLLLVVLPAILPPPSISFSPTKLISQGDLNETAMFEGDIFSYAENDTIWVGSGNARVVVLASHHDGSETFIIQNLTNPTIHLSAGSQLTLLVVNTEPNDFHNLALTTAAPPYHRMPMMQTMNSLGTEMLPPSQNESYWSQEMLIRSLPAGQYYYLCEYPDHAAEGMYGRLIVD